MALHLAEETRLAILLLEAKMLVVTQVDEQGFKRDLIATCREATQIIQTSRTLTASVDEVEA